MKLKEIIGTMSDEQIKKVADNICELVCDAVEEYNKNNRRPFTGDYCEICPFTKFCSVGNVGFVTFINQEVK